MGAGASTPPPLAAGFYGAVSVNGGTVPAGVPVSAWVAGRELARSAVRMVDGQASILSMCRAISRTRWRSRARRPERRWRFGSAPPARSSERPGYTAERALDGDPVTRWLTAAGQAADQ
ncbi:MAG: hypothetical protein HYV63_27500, partial [Candidatus Schekmanbacteria bacterium]|nr:hypothetical protein [Candidatus Schekmanbacteria bacterium]